MSLKSLNINKNFTFLCERYFSEELPRIAVLRGGTGSGKTYSALQFLVLLALKNKAKTIHVVSVTYPHLKNGAYKDMINILSSMNVKYTTNKVDLSVFINNTEIKFIATDKPEKFRGLRRDVLFVNEVNLITREIFDELIVRTRDFTIVDFNPVAKFFIIDYFSEKSLDISKYEIVTTYLDNPFLSEAAKYEIESRINTDWFIAYGKGEWLAEGTTAWYNWYIEDKPIKNLLGIGLDIGYTISPSAAVLLYKAVDDSLCAKFLFKGTYRFSEIVEKLQKYKTEVRIAVDAAAKEAVEDLRRQGFAAWSSTKPSLLASFERLNAHKIFVTSDSYELIKEARNLVWIDKTKGKLAGEDHAVDALRYAFHTFFAE